MDNRVWIVYSVKTHYTGKFETKIIVKVCPNMPSAESVAEWAYNQEAGSSRILIEERAE